MARATPESIRAVIAADPNLELNQFIVAANALTDYVDSRDTGNLLSETLLANIETYLAAYLLALKDQQYAGKSTGGASGHFQTGQRGKGKFEANDWGVAAMALDVTGTLATINSESPKPPIRVHWLGKTECERTNWWDR
jgi:hypothetical protein